MPDNESADDLETRAVTLGGQGQYADARGIFERVLAMRVAPRDRARVLLQIMISYDIEGDRNRAADIGRQALRVPGLRDAPNGVRLHNEIAAWLRLLRVRALLGDATFTTLLAAYFGGASIGAAVGRSFQGLGFTLYGQPISQDLRYGGAGLGALLGVFLFSRVMASVGSIVPLIASVGAAAYTTYLLLQPGAPLGIAVLGLLVLSFLYLLSVLATITKIPGRSK